MSQLSQIYVRMVKDRKSINYGFNFWMDIIHHISTPMEKSPMMVSHRCQKQPSKIQHTFLTDKDRNL